jgi:cytochrome c
MDNPDARLVRIEYAAGNRPPTAQIKADALAGAAPFTTQFKATGSRDLDPGDSLHYVWSVGGESLGTDSIIEWTFREAGVYNVLLRASDRHGAATETSLRIQVGNEPPRVALVTDANQSFYFQNKFDWPYDFRISDAEDEQGAGVDPDRARVRYSYVAEPDLLTEIRTGSTRLPSGSLRYLGGAQLIGNSDCYSCHNPDTENVGPAYVAVAQRYTPQPAIITQLANKIINGGNGVWGERLMSAHPQVSLADAESMVRYILSLRDEERLPLRGKLALTAAAESAGGFVIATQYRDRGAPGAEPLTGESLTILRAPKLEAEHAADELARAYVPQGGDFRAFQQVNFRPGGRLTLQNLDLKGIRTLELRVHAAAAGELSLFLGTQSTPPIATRSVAADTDWRAWKTIIFKLPATATRTDLHLVWAGPDGQVVDDMGHHRPADVGWLDWLEFKR